MAEAQLILNVWPSIFLTSQSPYKLETRLVYLESAEMVIPQFYCFFLPITSNKPGLLNTPAEIGDLSTRVTLSSVATQINATHAICEVP